MSNSIYPFPWATQPITCAFFFFFFLRGAVYCRAEGIISRHTTRCRPLYGARSGVNAGLGGLSGHASQADGVIGRYAAVHL